MGKNNPRLRPTARAVFAAGVILSVAAHASTSFTTISASNSEYVNFNSAATNLFRNVSQIGRTDTAQEVSSTTVTFTSSDESAPAMGLNAGPSTIRPMADLLFLYNGEEGLKSVDPLLIPTAVQSSENTLVFNNSLRTDPLVGLQIQSNMQALSYLGLNPAGIGVLTLAQINPNADLWFDPTGGGPTLPEPATWILMAGGLSGLALLRRRPDLFSRRRD